ncbi:MAG: hypothetical protein ACT6WE_26110, partial [Shinella sp.]|uniref:hypothetical protein n=1 Tax=Shinella sp. TaxID=1870904 RepID=UPI004035C37B
YYKKADLWKILRRILSRQRRSMPFMPLAPAKAAGLDDGSRAGTSTSVYLLPVKGTFASHGVARPNLR